MNAIVEVKNRNEKKATFYRVFGEFGVKLIETVDCFMARYIIKYSQFLLKSGKVKSKEEKSIEVIMLAWIMRKHGQMDSNNLNEWFSFMDQLPQKEQFKLMEQLNGFGEWIERLQLEKYYAIVKDEMLK